MNTERANWIRKPTRAESRLVTKAAQGLQTKLDEAQTAATGFESDLSKAQKALASTRKELALSEKQVLLFQKQLTAHQTSEAERTVITGVASQQLRSLQELFDQQNRVLTASEAKVQEMQVTHTTELSKLQGKSAALETEEMGKLNLEVEKLPG